MLHSQDSSEEQLSFYDFSPKGSFDINLEFYLLHYSKLEHNQTWTYRTKP